jgi:hypothetical protein
VDPQSHDDIYGARIDRAGNMIASSFDRYRELRHLLSESFHLSQRRTVDSSPTTNENSGADPDICLKLLDGTTLLDGELDRDGDHRGNLSAHEWQTFPDVDSDRDSRSHTRVEAGGALHRYLCRDRRRGRRTLQLSEGHQLIAGSMNVQKDAAIASAGGSGAPWRLELVVATRGRPIPARATSWADCTTTRSTRLLSSDLRRRAVLSARQ